MYWFYNSEKYNKDYIFLFKKAAHHLKIKEMYLHNQTVLIFFLLQQSQPICQLEYVIVLTVSLKIPPPQIRRDA